MVLLGPAKLLPVRCERVPLRLLGGRRGAEAGTGILAPVARVLLVAEGHVAAVTPWTVRVRLLLEPPVVERFVPLLSPLRMVKVGVVRKFLPVAEEVVPAAARSPVMVVQQASRILSRSKLAEVLGDLEVGPSRHGACAVHGAHGVDGSWVLARSVPRPSRAGDAPGFPPAPGPCGFVHVDVLNGIGDRCVMDDHHECADGQDEQ
mmetsp:Transcript_63500/g.150456  ORF Transcript_63500/g.150456 Transcript_63500/m.150456 type:complete len:205 (+) Transcript_63500:38-652(+)